MAVVVAGPWESLPFFLCPQLCPEERQQCPERPLRRQHPPPRLLQAPAVWGLRRGCYSGLPPPTRSRGKSRGASAQPRLPPERQVTERGLHGPAPALAATHRDSRGLFPVGGSMSTACPLRPRSQPPGGPAAVTGNAGGAASCFTRRIQTHAKPSLTETLIFRPRRRALRPTLRTSLKNHVYLAFMCEHTHRTTAHLEI